MSAIVIRRLSRSDEQRWRGLWRGYNDFYRRGVEDRVTDRLWGRLVAEGGDPFGLAAEAEGELAGFAHYFLVASTSDWAPRCYMQDLFADPTLRGRGIGRALIEAVYAEADKAGAAQTYWLTEETNAQARRLYDRLASRTSFIKYAR